MLPLLTALSLAFQSQVADTSPFRPLALPAPSPVRSASGGPGPEYWQQRADYVIRATLDTATQTIRGAERIHYVNHSPDTLEFVWVQIEQNIFASNSITYVLNQPPLHFAGGAVFDFTGKGFIGGITIDRFTAYGRELARTAYGTMMRVELARPLAPQGFVDFPSRLTAAGAWGGSATACMRSASGTRAWWSTTTSAAGIPFPTSARGSSTSSTATTT